MPFWWNTSCQANVCMSLVLMALVSMPDQTKMLSITCKAYFPGLCIAASVSSTVMSVHSELSFIKIVLCYQRLYSLYRTMMFTKKKLAKIVIKSRRGRLTHFDAKFGLMDVHFTYNYNAPSSPRAYARGGFKPPPPIGLSTKMNSKENITFLALLSLFFCNDTDSNMI